jgi:hypothetical protein
MRRKIKWCGPVREVLDVAMVARKHFLLVGRCKSEVYQLRVDGYVWHTFDARGIGGQNAEEPSLGLAKIASMNALIRQAARGGDWHIGQRSLAELKKLVALAALEGRVHGH